MAVGKNKKPGKSKKGGKKKLIDPFSKKDWYDVKAPAPFAIRQVGKTIVSRTQGTRLARDGLVGRVYTASLGDLKPDGEDDAFRKFKLIADEVIGTQVLTNFYGMDMSTDKLRSVGSGSGLLLLSSTRLFVDVCALVILHSARAQISRSINTQRHTHITVGPQVAHARRGVR
jgi:hypothetical protein